ncbi:MULTISPECIES: DUF1365 domain-containing protein [unclassified Devosia]|uniref:DUF1365 domain-containing protein n=1 Tax=unclassified Devosia TaxID=196773 RepID=UPI00145EA418|nr:MULTISPECIES: DUF1365 domain-containing protein [unclassified Devosia]MBJ6986313.1 DUF1365 domain-containing protein [Devosia sp. MC521]QMW64208.1 DUF1365 domain-containing protein [Devosia sp. MC521]
MTQIVNSAIYVGEVVHQRHRPKKHALKYRVFSLLIDLDELPLLNTLKHFGHNRRALFSFLDADHGDGGSLRDWAEGRLTEAGFAKPSRIRVLCYPRILGYVFNPLTVWYCDDENGAPIATIYEVHNTFKERHTYVLGANDIEQSAEKGFYVSPFIDMDCVYNFRLVLPGERVMVAINETQNREPLLYAAFTGTRQDFSDKVLKSLFFSHPLMTLKVTGGIYVEALKLLSKGIKIRWHTGRKKPAAASQRIS